MLMIKAHGDTKTDTCVYFIAAIRDRWIVRASD